MSNILYIPEGIRETLFDLDYVGGVTEGKKLFIKEHTYVGDSDYYLRYKRYMEGENLEIQLVYMKKLFNNYVRLKKSHDGVFLKRLNDAFIRFYKGIHVLCITYQVNPKLNKFCEYLNNYRKMKFLQDE